MNARYTNPDQDTRGAWLSNDLTAAGERSAGHYPVTSPSGTVFDSPQGKHWLYSQETMERLITENRIWFGQSGNAFPRLKRFLSDVQQGRRASTLWLHDEVGHTDEATKQFRELFSDSSIVFNAPKPTRLIQRMLQIGTTPETDDIILDFFAGSGTSAQAVLDQNREDSGNRTFILVQLPEPTDNEDFKTIAEVTKERVRRVIQRSEKGVEEKLNLGSNSKAGFRVLKLATSNFSVWSATTETITPDELGHQLDLHIDHIQKGRASEDLLYEILLKSGFALTTPVETFGIDGKAVHSVANGAMLICLALQLTHETIRGIADLKPERVVCLDEAFAGNDQLKTNAVLIMKSKGVTKLQTI
jgi:adenine-specific DNA-methyltransferase